MIMIMIMISISISIIDIDIDNDYYCECNCYRKSKSNNNSLKVPSIYRGYCRWTHGFYPSVISALVFWMVMTDSVSIFSEGFSTSSSFFSYSYPSSPSSLSLSSGDSPWASSTWLLKLDFCRPQTPSEQTKQEDNTKDLSNNNAPFSSYGALGSRLVVNCPVMVEADDDINNKKYPDAFIGRGASVIRPYTNNEEENVGKNDDHVMDSINNDNNFEYVTMKGTRRIELSPGGWTVNFPPGGISNHGKASKLKFYLDLKTDLERNDIVLPAGTRLYFIANAWREKEYDSGQIKIKPIRDEFNKAQQILDDQLSHESGDRRLDGIDPIETLRAIKDMTGLVLNRDRKRTALRDAINGGQDGFGYPSSDDHPEGPWPGSTDWLTVSEDNPIYARVPKRKKKNGDKDPMNLLQQFMSRQGREGKNDYHFGRVGTWTGEAISSFLLEDE
mmetsp:Transcript_17383/g.19656  ORF Transcript_17383/g.19656 Transcript_17383/m.19656 type:complete len:444 (-) Transcript_17383:134-1465(-)